MRTTYGLRHLGMGMHRDRVLDELARRAFIVVTPTSKCRRARLMPGGRVVRVSDVDAMLKAGQIRQVPSLPGRRVYAAPKFAQEGAVGA